HVQIGKKKEDYSDVFLSISADGENLAKITKAARALGATFPLSSPAHLSPATADKVAPDDFYSTTNLKTFLNIEGEWVAVQDLCMDKLIVVRGREAFCKKQNEVKKGEMVVVGTQGIRAESQTSSVSQKSDFSFMESDVSSEKDTELEIKKVASLLKEMKNKKEKTAFIIGPVAVHTGGVRHLSSIIRKGYCDLILAGNAAAVHDIELALFGTTLGMCHKSGQFLQQGNSNHLRAINAINRAGSIKKAYESGVLKSGIFYECEKKGVPYVLAGSLRDDGPLPEVISDMRAAQKKYFEAVRSKKLVLMLASTLHSIGVGNMLTDSTITVCVDINPAAVV
ncbi:TIGR00300 family protein, partial [Candidatus Micrarchaeota archaeon CG11_big_fil_rev_8_21_14_0_20_47_5]